MIGHDYEICAPSILPMAYSFSFDYEQVSSVF